MDKILILILGLAVLSHLCTSCEDCSNPTKMVCVEKSCKNTFFYNPAIKTMMPTRSCKCLKYEEVRNDCYFEKKGE